MLALRDALVSSKYVSHLQILPANEKNSSQLHSVGPTRRARHATIGKLIAFARWNGFNYIAELIITGLPSSQ